MYGHWHHFERHRYPNALDGVGFLPVDVCWIVVQCILDAVNTIPLLPIPA